MARHFEHAWVDSARAPLLLARFPDSPSVKEVEDFCVAFERFLKASDAQFGWVTDLSELHHAGAVQRQVFVEANRRNAVRMAQQVAAMGVYAPRPFQRGLVTLFNWFVSTPYPFKVFGEHDEAIAWVLGHLERR